MMNFTKVISQLNKVEENSRQIDKKFMTDEALKKKYKNISNINHSKSNNPTQATEINQPKHRYYQDIRQDEIEDQKIFGFSFYQFLFSQKRNQTENNKLFVSTKNQSKKCVEIKTPESIFSVNQIKQKLQRPKTSVIQRGVPTKRRLHHKLSLGQVQKVANSQDLARSSHQLNQQFFTESFFNFKSSEKQNIKKSNFSPSNQQPIFTIQPSTSHHSFLNKKSLTNLKKEQSKSFLNENKNDIDFKNNFKEFYEKNKTVTNLKRKKKYSLDTQKIKLEKANFNKNVETLFQNLTKKKYENKDDQENMFSNSIVYEQKIIPDQKSVTMYMRKNDNSNKNSKIEFTYQNFEQDEKIEESCYLDDNLVKQETNPIKQKKSAVKKVCFQAQLTQKPKFQTQELLLKHKLTFDFSIIHSTNELFLQSHELIELEFEQGQEFGFSSHFIEDKIMKELINGMTQKKEFKNKTLHDFSSKTFRKIHNSKPQIYHLFLFATSTLECLKLDDIKISKEGIYYERKLISIFELCQKLLAKKEDSEFIHVFITRQPDNLKSNKLDSQQNEKNLVFETFIHKSDIRYNQGREVEIQYFKYFLKRFITFDESIKNKKQIEQSLRLILQSEVSTPLEFEQFCKDIDVKGNINIFTIKNSQQKNNELIFRCFNINLSDLLMDAHQSIQMIKKELFEGYNWKGVSLKKQLEKKKGKQLEHFYI